MRRGRDEWMDTNEMDNGEDTISHGSNESTEPPTKHRVISHSKLPPSINHLTQPVLLINKTSLKIRLNLAATKCIFTGSTSKSSQSEYNVEELIRLSSSTEDLGKLLNKVMKANETDRDWESQSLITIEFKTGDPNQPWFAEAAVSSFVEDGIHWYILMIKRTLPSPSQLCHSRTPPALLSSPPLPFPPTLPPALTTSRPTSLPPPSVTLPRSEQNELRNTLLRYARETIPSLRAVGVILVDKSLGNGFVNGSARHLLMGIAEIGNGGGTGTASEDWWSRSEWTSTSDGEGWTTFSGSSGFTSAGVFQHHHKEMTNPFFPSLEKQANSTPSAGKLFQPPLHRPPTTVAHILAHSFLREKRGASFDGMSSSPRRPWMEALDQSQDRCSAHACDSRSTISGSYNGDSMKKPYRVFDVSFSRRILDPLEELMEKSAKAGEVFGDGVIVGIEVDVSIPLPPPGTLAPSLIASNPAASSRQVFTRRSLVEIRGVPIYDSHKQHLGGMLTLKRLDPPSSILNANSARAESNTHVHQSQRKDNGEAHLKQVLDHLPQLVFTARKDGYITFFNSAWFAYTGLQPEDSYGQGWIVSFHQEDIGSTVEAWSHSLLTGDPYTVEYRCLRHDGVYRWFLGRALPVRNDTGEIEGWVGTCTDIHDSILARVALKKAQDQISIILRSGALCLTAIDLSRKITFFQGALDPAVYDRINDVTVVGRLLQDVWPDSPIYNELDRVMRGEITVSIMNTKPEQTFGTAYRMSMTPLTELSHGEIIIVGAVLVGSDITDTESLALNLREAQEEHSRLAASESRAQDASRLKSEFVANMSHEIRTPIAAMLGQAELLLEDLDSLSLEEGSSGSNLKENHRSGICKILRSGEILLEVVSSVLDIGKIEVGKLQLEHLPFFLVDVVSDALLFATAARKKGLIFNEDVDRNFFEGLLVGDASRFRQCLANILSNAIKFTSVGQVTFRMRQEQETSSHCHLMFMVQDSGIGVSPEAIPILFKPFSQADTSTARRYGGSGLGLTISKNLVELMGGSISLDSVYGTGTTMTVRVSFEKASLQLVDSHRAMHIPNPASPLYPHLRRSDYHILVAEDNRLLSEITERMLLKMGFNVKVVGDGLAVLAALTTRRYDLILMDGQMPSLDGYQCSTKIRNAPDPLTRATKIIALTASVTLGDEAKCLKAGMDGYLSKPVRARILEETILRHLS